MQCESCNVEISSKMRAAFQKNTCPFCGDVVLNPKKAEQYVNLLNVLDETTFTNRPEVDSQIKEKVANLLVTKFVFMKLDQEAQPRDVIILDEPEAIIITKLPTSTPTPSPALETKSINEEIEAAKVALSKKAAHAPSRPLQKKKVPALEKEMTLMDSLGQDHSKYSSEDDLDSEDPMDGLSEDEVKRFFPTLSGDDMKKIKESNYSSNNVQRGLTGKGIKRI